MPWTLRPATPDDEAPILRLLERLALPAAGVRDHLSRFLVAERDGRLVGCVGVEHHGAHGLLRSVAVEPAHAGAGLGAALVARALDEARAAGLADVHLLTTTAAAWFPRFGFAVVPAGSLPTALDASAERRGACPDSAAAMRLVFARAEIAS